MELEGERRRNGRRQIEMASRLKSMLKFAVKRSREKERERETAAKQIAIGFA
jgi:hypothetical protein